MTSYRDGYKTISFVTEVAGHKIEHFCELPNEDYEVLLQLEKEHPELGTGKLIKMIPEWKETHKPMQEDEIKLIEQQ